MRRSRRLVPHLRRLLLTLLLVLALPATASLALTDLETEPFEDTPGWPDLSQIYADAVVLYDATDDIVLLDYHGDARLYCASTTKMLTALTASRSALFDDDARLTVSGPATRFGDPESMRVGFVPGEHVRTEDCLAAMLLHSGNDSARVIAENYGGGFGLSAPGVAADDDAAAEASREAFVSEMNRVAASVGATSTTFLNPCGFDDEGHLTTAHDLVLIARALLDDPRLARYTCRAHYIMPPTDRHEAHDWAMLTNSNRLVVYGPAQFGSLRYRDYVGVKTGTTPRAGNCLVGAGLTHHGHLIICAMLGGLTDASYSSGYISSSVPVRVLLEYGAHLAHAPVRRDLPRLGPAPSAMQSASEPASQTPSPPATTAAGASASKAPRPSDTMAASRPFAPDSSARAGEPPVRPDGDRARLSGVALPYVLAALALIGALLLTLAFMRKKK